MTLISAPVSASRHRAARIVSAASALLIAASLTAPAFAQTPTMIVMRAASSKKGDTGTAMPPLKKDDIAEVKIGGKAAEITGFDPVLKGPHNLQLMVLLDSMQMLGAGGQFADIQRFFNDLPPNVEIGVGWLLQGKVKVAQPFTTDRDLAGKALVAKTREEAANPKNDNGNPFMCLRDIATHWPDPDPKKLRAVLMFTDGIIRNNNQSSGGEQKNPDVEGASLLLQRASIVPYPFFWMDPIIPDPNRKEGGQLEGQTNFSQLVENTGGVALQEGMFAPGSLTPLLNKLYEALNSEAVVTVNAPGKEGKFTRLDVKSSKEDEKIVAPDQVMIGNVLKK